jgi:hypothetical protein
MRSIATGIGLSTLLFLAGAALLPAQTTRPLSPPASRPATRPASFARVAGLLDDLESLDADKVTRARQALPGLPPEAVPQLEDALRSALSRPNRLVIQRAIVAIHNKPIRAERLRAEAEANHAAALKLRKAYHAGGNTNPKWDRLVDDFFDRMAKAALPPNITDVAQQKIVFGQIVAAGCTDPYFRGQALAPQIGNATPATRLDQLRADLKACVEDMRRSAYPADIKMDCCSLYVKFLLRFGRQMEAAGGGDILGEIRRVNALCVEMLPEAIKQFPQDAEGPWHPVVNTYEAMYAVDPTVRSFDTVHGAVVKAAPNSYVGPLLQAAHFSKVKVRWAPGDEAGARRAEQQMQEGEAKVREGAMLAWERAPQFTAAAAYMMNITKVDEEFELWFRRATAGNPDNTIAYSVKLAFLMGTDRKEAAHVFARSCADHDVPAMEIILVLPLYHHMMGTVNEVPDAEYFKDPAVFEEIQEVYERYLGEAPDSVHQRCMYARYACWAERWDVAQKQFARLGDRFDPGVFASKQQYDYLRLKAERNRGN